METKPTLLLVEDEPDLRDALGEYLEACGFAVTVAATAADAWNEAGAHEPQIVLCDLSLPDQRGDAFLVGFHQVFPRPLLFVHSGDSQFCPSDDLVGCGVTTDRVFTKPADLPLLVKKLQDCLLLPG